DRDVERLGESRLHGADLGIAEDFLVAAQHLPGDRMKELLALAEDGELLADLRSPAPADVQVEGGAFDTDHQPLERAEGLGEVVTHECEGRPDAIGHPRGGIRKAREHGDDDVADDGPGARAHNVTDGLWIPNPPRSRSQISPRVTPTSTAATRRGSRLSRPR